MRLGLAATLLLFASSVPARAHPMHNTITELSEDRARGTVRAMIRVFADDYGSVLRRSKKQPLEYVASTFALIGRDGRAIALHSCGIREQSGVVWLCVEGDSREGLGALQLRANVLCDLYDDQINVVQATVGGVRRSFLFTRGAKARSLG